MVNDPVRKEPSPQVNTQREWIETIIAVMAEGKSVELPAAGYSMFPTLRPGDRILAEPTGKGRVPVPGSIIIYKSGDQFIVHRLVRIFINEAGIYYFEARGDSMSVNDPVLPAEKIVGVAKSFKRNHICRTLKSSILPRNRYRLNRLLLWCHFKIKKIRTILTTSPKVPATSNQ